MTTPEILAPVGGEEQLLAAVRCGADAVYLGTKHFNARNAAVNFDGEALKNAVQYCHARAVKVYVTMNTLITDSEMDDVIAEIKAIAASGADAVILQDLAAAQLWQTYCPEMRLHASTQMAIHNVSGAVAAEKMGFKRIVLARELSLREIKKIADSVNTEIEVFVHGALCMSVSGTCLLSSMIGARSGNRGRCAQPCRLNFKCNDREYALSLKDLSVIDDLQALHDAGVTSFKIEGRMKRPEYVAAAVTAARDSLAGQAVDMSALQAVFSRSGFTKGYLEGKRNSDMFGYRRHEDVTAAGSVLGRLKTLYKDEIKKIPVDMSLCVTEHLSSLTVSDGKNSVTVNGDTPSEAKTLTLSKEYAEKCFSKTGGTIFIPNSFQFSCAEGMTLTASQMNTMRRNALEQLYTKRTAVQPKNITEPPIKTKVFSLQSRNSALRVRFERFSQVFDASEIEKIILPMREILSHQDELQPFLPKLICELPFLVFPDNEDKFIADLKSVKNLGVKDALADNIGTLFAAEQAGFITHGGHGLNILNSTALAAYEKHGIRDATLSPELSMKAIGNIACRTKKGIIGYGFLPLMRFRACPAQSKEGCKNCKGLTKITDRIGTAFYIMCADKKYSSLLNSVPLYIGDKQTAALDFITLYFTVEQQDTCRKILRAFTEKRALNTKKTGGLYYRELL